MNKISRFLICMALLCVVVSLSLPVNASYFPHPVTDCTEEEKNNFLEAIGFSLLENEPEKSGISCFDVRQDGWIALGFQNSSRKVIAVYSAEGTFQYGYTYEATGDFAISWIETDLSIYFYRSGLVASFDKNGNCTKLAEYDGYSENYEYIRKNIRVSSRQINGNSYKLVNDVIFGGEYGKLIITYHDGTEFVFYDSSQIHNLSVIITLICVVLFFATVISGVIRKNSTGKHNCKE